MEIRLNVETFTPKHLGALIGAMLACGTLTREALAHVVSTWAMPMPGVSRETLTLQAMREAPVSMVLQFFTETIGALTKDELNRLIADLNAELYSRRAIKPNDNPASGVEKAALNSDAVTATFNRVVVEPMVKEMAAAMGDTLDVASIFAKADTSTAIIAHVEQGDATSEPLPNISVVAQGVTLDKNNLPWDARIHAASKAVNADGTWRQRRGVDAALVVTVEAELRGVMAIPTVSAVVTGKPQVDGRNGVMAEDAAPIVPPRPPLPPKPPTPPLSASETTLPKGEPLPEGDPESPTTFPQLLKFITAGKLAGKFNQAQVGAALVAIGVEGPLPVLQARPDLIPAMVARLRAIGGA